MGRFVFGVFGGLGGLLGGYSYLVGLGWRRKFEWVRDEECMIGGFFVNSRYKIPA